MGDLAADEEGIARPVLQVGLRSIALLCGVAELGSIQRAAVASGFSQPGATQALALLQSRIGIPLLKRGLTGSMLTPAGEMFVSRVEPALDLCHEAIRKQGIAEPAAAMRTVTASNLRLIDLILQTGSLEGAGQAAGLTRNGVRRAAASIEQNLGTLFERTAKGTRLTLAAKPCAQVLVDAMRRIDLAIREARSVLAQEQDRLVVGAAQAFGNRFLAKLLAELAADNPHAQITVLRESPTELVTRLRAGEVDLVVGDIDEEGGDLLKARLVATPYHVFGRPGHPLTRLRDISVADLSGYDWVGGMPGSAREAALSRLFLGMALPRRAFSASEGAVVGHFVAGSDRLALLTEHESRCGGLALGKLPIPPLESGLGIDVVHHADRAPSTLHLELVRLLQEHLCPAEREGVRNKRHVA